MGSVEWKQWILYCFPGWLHRIMTVAAFRMPCAVSFSLNAFKKGKMGRGRYPIRLLLQSFLDVLNVHSLFYLLWIIGCHVKSWTWVMAKLASLLVAKPHPFSSSFVAKHNEKLEILTVIINCMYNSNVITWNGKSWKLWKIEWTSNVQQFGLLQIVLQHKAWNFFWSQWGLLTAMKISLSEIPMVVRGCYRLLKLWCCHLLQERVCVNSVLLLRMPA